jgi:hypothetical protein
LTIENFSGRRFLFAIDHSPTGSGYGIPVQVWNTSRAVSQLRVLVRCGFPWEKTTDTSFGSVYAYCEPLGCFGGSSFLPRRESGSQAMEERDFFEEKSEQRKHTLTCPHCGKAEEYEVAWLVRRKKAQLHGRPDERDRARFAKAQSYMVRKDDTVACKNIRCRKRFEVSSLQSVAFL